MLAEASARGCAVTDEASALTFCGACHSAGLAALSAPSATLFAIFPFPLVEVGEPMAAVTYATGPADTADSAGRAGSPGCGRGCGCHSASDGLLAGADAV